MPKSELLPTLEKQAEAIRETGESPAFTVSQSDIDHVIRMGSGFEGGKLRIFQFYQRSPSAQESAAFLKKEYGIGGGSVIFKNGTRGDSSYDHRGLAIGHTSSSFTNPDLRLSWSKVEHRLWQLIHDGQYLSEEEKSCRTGDEVYLVDGKWYTVEAVMQTTVTVQPSDFPLFTQELAAPVLSKFFVYSFKTCINITVIPAPIDKIYPHQKMLQLKSRDHHIAFLL